MGVGRQAKTTLILAALAVLGGGAHSRAVAQIATWVEHAANPVIAPPAAECYYPSALYDASAFAGHGDNYPFKLWCDKNFRLYGSPDGVTWFFLGDQTTGAITGLVGGGRVRHTNVEYYSSGFAGQNAGDPAMFYRVWYWDSGQLYAISAIRYAESPDGRHWFNDQAITQDGTRKLIGGLAWTPGLAWNRGSYGPIDVLYNPGASNTGADPFNWTFVLYYDGTTGGDQAIGLAYSADGKHWTAYDRNGDTKIYPVAYGSAWDAAYQPVPNSATLWDRNYVTEGTVLRDQTGFHLWYSGGNGAANHGIGHASSSDGKVWSKDPAPVFSRSDAGYPGYPWRSTRTYTPMVTDVGACRHMWFSGATGDGSRAVTGYAYIPCDVTPPVLSVPPASDTVTDATGPAGAVVTFTVTAYDAVDGPVTPTCTPPSGSLFAIGNTTIACSATDAHGNTGSASFTVHVNGAAEQLAALGASVLGLGPGQSLASKVLAAQAAVGRGDGASACGSLTALANEARAQSGKKLLPEQANRIVAATDRIRAVLGCK